MRKLAILSPGLEIKLLIYWRKPHFLHFLVVVFMFLHFLSGCHAQSTYSEQESEAIEMVKVLRRIFDEVRSFDEKVQSLPEVLAAFGELNKRDGRLEYAIWMDSLPQSWLKGEKHSIGYYSGYSYNIVAGSEAGVLALPMTPSNTSPRLFFARLPGGNYEHPFDDDLIQRLNAGAPVLLEDPWKGVLILK
jgi:hypothetical protein